MSVEDVLLGVTSGATLGAVIVVLHVGEIVGLLTLPIAAFIGALLSMLLVLAIASRDPAHYKSSVGTLFLTYIAEVLGRVLPRFTTALRAVR